MENCGAKTRSGGKCRKSPVPGARRCRFHGGKSLSGPANPAWKTGRYSKWAQCFGSRGKAIAEAADDDELLNLRRTVAVFEVAMREAAKRLDQGDSPEWRKRARELFAEATDATAEMDARQRAMMLLQSHLAKGADEDKAYAILLDRTERLHRAVSETLDTMLRGANVLNRQQAEVFVRAIFDILRAETAPEVSSRVLSRLDTEVMGGRLAVRGVVAAEALP